MANTLGPFSPTYWSRLAGAKLYKKTLFRSLADWSEEAVLTDGQIVDRPYFSDVEVEKYTKGTALSAQDVTATTDKLTVNQSWAILIYIDDIDKKQNKYSYAELGTNEIVKRLAINEDAFFLYEVRNATDTIDDGDVGGTAGNGITVTVNNIDDIFAGINMKLDVNDVEEDERFLVESPHFHKVLWKRISGKESMLGDRTAEFGNAGRYANIELFKSNNLTAEADWVPADDPTNTATIVIEGITFTFVSSIGTTAGNILISGTVAGTLDNLVALINAGGTTSDSGVSNVSLSAANRRVVQKWVAVDGATKITIYGRGESYFTVSSSESADVWTTTRQIQNLLAGRKKAISGIVQIAPDVAMASTVSAGKRGVNIMPLDLFGFHVYNKGKAEILKVELRSDGY